MTQSTTSVSTKTIGSGLLADDINDIVSVVNANVTDVDTRSSSIVSSHNDHDGRLTTIESDPPYITGYTTETLPETADEGTLALNVTDGFMMVFKDGKWINIHTDVPIALSDFIFVISGDSFALPLTSVGTYNFSIDWGDGNSDIITAWDDVAAAHTYSTTGQYTITVSGEITGWIFGTASAEDTKLIEITSIGSLALVDTAQAAFYGATNLTSIDNSSPLETTGVTTFRDMYRLCTSLTQVPMMDATAGTDYQHMFHSCNVLTELPPFDFGAPSNIKEMFFNALALTSISNITIDTTNVGNFAQLFFSCKALTTVPDAWCNTPNATAMNGMFRGCNALTTLPTPAGNILNTTGLNNLSQMFRDCWALDAIPAINTTSNTTFWRFAQNCKVITSFPSLNTSTSTNFDNTWNGCTSLTTFPLLDMSNGTNFNVAWQNCALTAQSIENILTALVNGNKSNLSTSFSGGTNASKSTWTATANTHYDTLVNTRGWTIAHNA